MPRTIQKGASLLDRTRNQGDKCHYCHYQVHHRLIMTTFIASILLMTMAILFATAAIVVGSVEGFQLPSVTTKYSTPMMMMIHHYHHHLCSSRPCPICIFGGQEERESRRRQQQQRKGQGQQHLLSMIVLASSASSSEWSNTFTTTPSIGENTTSAAAVTTSTTATIPKSSSSSTTAAADTAYAPPTGTATTVISGGSSSSGSTTSKNTRPIAITEPSKRQLEANDILCKQYGVKRSSKLPKIYWKMSWKYHHKILPLLHYFDKKVNPKDNDKSLRCLWCKGIASVDINSPTYDNGITYDMLPKFTRSILRLPNFLFPNMIHTNIELRTTYLDTTLRDILKERAVINSDNKVRLITMGAGYDTRSVRFLSQGLIDEAYELDLPSVAQSKKIMLERLKDRRMQRSQSFRQRLLRRLFRTRGDAVTAPTTDSVIKLPNVIPIDLNDVNTFRQTLEEIISNGERTNASVTDVTTTTVAAAADTPSSASSTTATFSDSNWYNVFLFEGVMIYLDDGVPSALLRICSDFIRKKSSTSSGDDNKVSQNNTTARSNVIFADLLRNVPLDDQIGDLEREAARIELLTNGGWELDESTFYTKPGWARHMGTAHLRSR